MANHLAPKCCACGGPQELVFYRFPQAMTAQVITHHLVGAKLKIIGLMMILTCMLIGCEY